MPICYADFMLIESNNKKIGLVFSISVCSVSFFQQFILLYFMKVLVCGRLHIKLLLHHS